jgi:zinc/manganese transport system ATP-binding protein
MTNPPDIVLEQVALRHGNRSVVSGLSGCFPGRSMTAVIGPNGAGKTTLLRALAGLHPLAAGRIDRGGLRKADIALLPQGASLDRGFPIACLDVVALAAPGLGSFRAVRPAERSAAAAALHKVGLAGLESRPVQALSAGQFQRLLFARTILQDSPVILLDEPFTAVDAATRDLLLTILQLWHQQGRTLIVVLHDMDIVREHFPHTLLLDGSGGSRWDAEPVLPVSVHPISSYSAQARQAA